VVLTKLANPLYPPLARQTGITGDVELMLEIRNDGSIQSVDVVKGHP
jgi:outer membrane biosynthesis protein TonB